VIESAVSSREPSHRGRPGAREHRDHGTPGRDADAPVATRGAGQPGRVLGRQGTLEPQRAALGGELLGRRRGAEQALGGIARRGVEEEERQRYYAPDHRDPGDGALRHVPEHRPNLARSSRPR